MNNIDLVDVTKPMTFNDFWILFAHLPLNEEEQSSLKNDYFVMYELFLKNEVEPETAWVAVRNLFVAKEGEKLLKREKL